MLSALDSSILTLPFANDVAVIVLVSLRRDPFWVYVLAATLGSLAGCWVMFVIGRRGGESFIRAHMSPPTFARMQAAIGRKGPILLAAPALIPPPFPFTAFVLAAGALEVPSAPFLTTLTVLRFARFLLEAVAALYFGHRVVGWLETGSFRLMVDALMLLAIPASAWSLIRLVRATRRQRAAGEVAPPPGGQPGTK